MARELLACLGRTLGDLLRRAQVAGTVDEQLSRSFRERGSHRSVPRPGDACTSTPSGRESRASIRESTISLPDLRDSCTWTHGRAMRIHVRIARDPAHSLAHTSGGELLEEIANGGPFDVIVTDISMRS